MVLDAPGKLTMTFTPADGSAPRTWDIYDFKGECARNTASRLPAAHTCTAAGARADAHAAAAAAATAANTATAAGPGVGMGMYNTEESIMGFAESCFQYALSRKW